MQLFCEETLMKLKALPPEKRSKVIDGLAKMLAARPKEYLRDQREFPKRKALTETIQINVIYSNGNTGFAFSSNLDHLIKMNEIVAFCRSDGWVRIDRGPIRKSSQPFEGPGKRYNDFNQLKNRSY
jgi:hypothetical protein